METLAVKPDRLAQLEDLRVGVLTVDVIRKLSRTITRA